MISHFTWSEFDKSVEHIAKKWATKIETLHNYLPTSLRIEKLIDPMWE